jgi:hypothetical protein
MDVTIPFPQLAGQTYTENDWYSITEEQCKALDAVAKYVTSDHS